MKMLLIGGQALRQLGSSRHTNDFDYLVNDKSTTQAFITSQEVDYINANGNKFFSEIWKLESDNNSEIATPAALLELKHILWFSIARILTSKKLMRLNLTLNFFVAHLIYRFQQSLKNMLAQENTMKSQKPVI